jgi:hypothetical protein
MLGNNESEIFKAVNQLECRKRVGATGPHFRMVISICNPFAKFSDLSHGQMATSLTR